MTARCLNWENIVYDKCRFCTGYKTECKEYLADIERNSTGDISKKATPLFLSTYPSTPNNTRQTKLTGVNKSAEKPFYFGHIELIHNVALPKCKLLNKIRGWGI